MTNTNISKSFPKLSHNQHIHITHWHSSDVTLKNIEEIIIQNQVHQILIDDLVMFTRDNIFYLIRESKYKIYKSFSIQINLYTKKLPETLIDIIHQICEQYENESNKDIFGLNNFSTEIKQEGCNINLHCMAYEVIDILKLLRKISIYLALPDR
ncbi:hypothetical protein ACWIW6_02690 [Ursidibacter sp. B-7004-1]